MSDPRYIDIHALQTVPYSNLNRDDQGAPKTVVFGGAERTRISSQSWKRVIRRSVEEAVGDPAVRTRRVVRGVAERLQARGWPQEEAEAAGRQVARSAGNGIKLERSKDERDTEVLTTSVLLYLPEAGLENLTAIAEAHREAVVAEEAKPEAKRKGVLPSEEIAEVLGRRSAAINLFGRMLAELPGANVDGAVQFAHAFTTHATSIEYDFFAAVDDVEEQLSIPGSGHINTAMFSAGTFYRYANVDLRGLAANLGADTTTARDLVTAFLHAFILTLPTGKTTSTAPATLPDLVHIAVRDDRPVSLAAAFEAPVGATEGHLAPSQGRLDSYAAELTTLLGADHRLWAGHTATLAKADHLGAKHPSFDRLVADAVEAAYPRAAA
ncbi:type I-E CRISPR-associated protein Cas7/Cse4/CasC [Streptomonospora sp. S1-112]|uniref:Type I-E CRISPR-associated protein Cas7/Cse4/CasC n=1 Tax=Streptomonospora mangrovi TaxID=2883123 RepID=A0A9X3NI67_9ACTN|nr:type I-E CRISPR-associated protein Cas7/Cse4/CasC [Streptomonospora mangrovi]MDA0564157.1 type I-E CRISPR-associated protein Cas7/Cse4/CasC [Streptomonospora mangrovi]